MQRMLETSRVSYDIEAPRHPGKMIKCVDCGKRHWHNWPLYTSDYYGPFTSGRCDPCWTANFARYRLPYEARQVIQDEIWAKFGKPPTNIRRVNRPSSPDLIYRALEERRLTAEHEHTSTSTSWGRVCNECQTILQEFDDWDLAADAYTSDEVSMVLFEAALPD